MPHQIASTGRILVVTARPADETSLVASLEQHGHVVMTASDRVQTLEIAAIGAPDLILLDLPIPDLSGLELLATLHEQPRLQQIPVIVLAAIHDPQRLLRTFDAGAVDCIAMPCPIDEVLARVHVHLRLKLTRSRLEEVARERQELINLVAHDLKNPLTSVLFACEMLALPECRPERAPRYLQVIDDSTREALGYIRSYLENQARPAPVDPAAKVPCAHLGATLHWLAARFELQLEASGLRLQVNAPQPDVCVTIRELLLRQIGENLIGNALKYARDGGELELTARPGAPGYWQLLVQDRGPGIPASFQPRLFTPFQRVQEHDRHDAVAAVSSGLGLALARQNVANAGGRLWYEDREDGGARFLLELPEAHCIEHCA